MRRLDEKQQTVIRTIKELEHRDSEQLIKDVIMRQTHTSPTFEAFRKETEMYGDRELYLLLQNVRNCDYNREAQQRHRRK